VPSTYEQRARLEAARRLLHDAQNNPATYEATVHGTFQRGVESWLDGTESDTDMPALWAAAMLDGYLGRTVRSIIYARSSNTASQVAVVLCRYRADKHEAAAVMEAYDSLAALGSSYQGVASLLRFIGQQDLPDTPRDLLVRHGLLGLAPLVARYEGDRYALEALSSYCTKTRGALHSKEHVLWALAKIERTIAAVWAPRLVAAGRS